jgi:stage II sporulation protein D
MTMGKPAILLGLILVLLPAAARADELSRNDKLRVLYSNQFAFDRRGVPLVSVRVATGGHETVLEGVGPVRVLPDGEDGSEVLGGKRWKISLSQAKAAQLEHYAVLAREPVAAMEKLRAEMPVWQKRGARCRLIEVGTIFGVKGTVFDNRAYLLADGPFPTREQALQAAEAHARKHGLAKVAAVPQLKARPSGQFEVTDLESGARVRARDAVWFAPSKGEQLTVRSGKEGHAYWGQIYVTVDTDGTLAVVNSVPADRLLAGLVPAEIFPQAPEAALRAQAVAARGELLAKIGTHHIADPYLLCNTQHCQVYAGAGREHPRTSDAVATTRGMVLMRKNGGLVDTVYSASCGGHTEHNDNAWPVKADETLRGHLDGPPNAAGLGSFSHGIADATMEAWLAAPATTYCGRTRFNQNRYRWTERIPSARMNQMVKHLRVGPVQEVRLLQRGVSGRVNLLEVRGALGKAQVRGELEVRKLFGGLRSSMFVVKAAAGSDGRPEFVFRGGGWGHGVGMCQTGAIGMAEAGKTYQDILRHYYPGSELKPLY